MRFGVSAQDQRILAEERRQRRKPFSGEDGLEEVPPAKLESLNATDDDGNDLQVFVLGLHSPWDTTDRWIP